MADQETCKDIQVLKRTKIPVHVDEALPDLLVVTYEYGVKIFKGVLLDSTKKNLPCGIQTLNPAFTVPSKPNVDDDSLYSVNQRFAYTDPANAKKKNVHISTKYKNNKMTVRLRPRQVLCSKCKGICNENSENVTRKRKPPETAVVIPAKRGANAPITRSVNVQLSKLSNKRKLEVKRTLIPKVALHKLPNALSGNVNKLNIHNNKKSLAATVSNLKSAAKKACDKKLNPDSTHSIEHTDSEIATLGTDPKLKRILRKKRTNTDSVEELYEETVLEDANNKNNNLNTQNNANNNAEQPLSATCTNTTRTLKICYGPQGEGTVLKIPAQIENLNSENDLEENMNVDELNNKESHKAARKAMKKARKEAKRKVITSPVSASPKYTISGSSPRYTVGSASPRHGLGNNSPRYIPVSTLEANMPKKRKHKMKHKKKHREDKDKDRKHKEDEAPPVLEEPLKEPITQKLSINLKRLSTSYMATCQNNEKTEDSSSDEHNERAPDFPPHTPPALLRVNAQTVTSAIGTDGVRILAGDVVWGKLHGFPWWPGKILTITNCDGKGPHAHVSWYGSTTSSLIKCEQLSPYLENFSVRYNKKKKGTYREAIKQATGEARENAERKLKENIVASPSPARAIMTVVSPALASPREINVIS